MTQAYRQQSSDRGPAGRAVTLVGIVAILGFLAWSQFSGSGGPREGAPAPSFIANTLAGETFDLDDTAGKVVVLDFWATWCTPCIKSLPALQTVHERYARSDDVVIASINTDRGKNLQRRIELFVKNHRFDFPVVFDDTGSIQHTYRVESIPTMVILGRDGLVQKVKVGITTSNTDVIADNIQAAIEALL